MSKFDFSQLTEVDLTEIRAKLSWEDRRRLEREWRKFKSNRKMAKVYFEQTNVASTNELLEAQRRADNYVQGAMLGSPVPGARHVIFKQAA